MQVNMLMAASHPSAEYSVPNRDPMPKSHAVVAAGRLKAKDCLGDYQPDIVLHTVLETGRPMRYLIPRRGLRVNPDYAVGYAYRIAADVVGERIEGAAAGQIEPGVMQWQVRMPSLTLPRSKGKPM